MAVKLARANYFSAIISRNSRVFFSTVNAELHPVATPSLIPSVDICEAFLKKFICKVAGIRSQISSASNDLITPANPINQLTSFLPTFSAGHNTESALLISVSNDILGGADSGSCVVLLLLVLTAAFDTVDHDILIAHLKNHVGVQGLDIFSQFR